MRKRILSILLTLCMVLSIAPTAVFAEGSTAPADITGSGASDDPYLIYTAAGLKEFRDIVNGQNGQTKQPDACAKLMADIVLNDGTFDKDGNYTPGESGKAAEEWTPIGWFKIVDDNHPYTGTFDGGGYTIKGLYVNNPTGNAGLFAYIEFYNTSSSIQNITVEGYVSGYCAGGIVARSNGVRLLRCTNRAVVSGTYYSGGMIGNLRDQLGADHKLELCFNAGEVLSPTKNGFTGGLIGALYSEGHVSITNCANAAKLTGKNVGGLIGYASKYADVLTIKNCYSTAQFNADATRTGGIVGWPQDGLNVVITNSYWLEGTAEGVSYGDHANTKLTNVEAKSKAEFADGTVLGLLKGDRTDSPWADECQYVAAAGMTLPVFKGQGDSHTHSEKTGNCLDGIYCECGYLMHMATSGHNWGEWQHLTTSHTRTCKNPGCGVTQSGNCSGGTATCTEQAKCDVCHKSYGAKNPDNHTDTTEWIQTETKHTQKYTCCGAVTVAEEDHEWENGVCTECHYACAHTGGTATCIEQATCEVCHEKYGNKDPNNHTDITEWVQTETKHTQKYTCCGAVTVAEEDHEWENGVCSECGYGCAHSGGTATCTEQATCEICGESYGELDGNNHADMKHIEAKAATNTAEGNIEYWHCEGCGKYFADKDGLKEITKADTVTAKLPEEKPTSPTTGDTSNLALWIALLVISGGAVTATTVYGRKKKRLTK